MASRERDLPRDVLVIKQLLQSMGVEEYEPRVVNLLLDVLYRYVADILQDAEAYAERAGQPLGVVDTQDVMLAIQSSAATFFVQPPSQDVLLQLAQRRNQTALPEISKRFGLRLPPEEDCLIAPNYSWERPAPKQPKPAPKAKGQGGSADAEQAANVEMEEAQAKVPLAADRQHIKLEFGKPP